LEYLSPKLWLINPEESCSAASLKYFMASALFFYTPSPFSYSIASRYRESS
jgi:hypothetical protein